jgi:LPXTG-motif cell wall-anchored protein
VLFDGTGEGATVISISAENKIQRGSLRIMKTFEGRATPLAGVSFLIVGQTAFGEVRFEVKTDKNGEIVLTGIPVGTYVVTELKTDATSNYLLAPAQTVLITANRETVLKIINQLAKGEIKVLKLDSETGKPLVDAVFGLFVNDRERQFAEQFTGVNEDERSSASSSRGDGKLIAEAKSGKDGYAVFKDVAFGEYEVRELSAPVGYMRSEVVLKAVVSKDGSVILLEMTNEKIPGEPVQPEKPEIPVTPDMPVPPSEKPPKTGDNKTIVTVALVVLIIAGGVILWMRKRGKADEETTEEEEN